MKALRPFVAALAAASLLVSVSAAAPKPAVASPDVLQIQIRPGEDGAQTIFVSTIGGGETLTLPSLRTALQSITTTQLLEDQGGGNWLLGMNLTISGNLTLTLASDTVTWLKLRSNAAPGGAPSGYDPASFAHLRARNATLLISNTRVTSWDTISNTYDTDPSNGRAYVIARDVSRMDITNSDLSYLGSADGESYGVVWRDATAGAPNDGRVTGNVLNSIFSNNYYGIYTYRAVNMTWRGNTFRNNVLYGFDPHDYSHDFVVEDNVAYENGDHGFIVSRGCYNFAFRRNKSYNNRYLGDSKNAQGFMIDAGSGSLPGRPPVPSYNVLMENNEAWGNTGYGLRILSSYNNTIQNNAFTGNGKGVTVEQPDSYGNVIKGNTITGNTGDAVVVEEGAYSNTIEGNTITGNGRYGVYLKETRQNQLLNNVIAYSAQQGIRATGLPTQTFQNTWTGNAIHDNGIGGISVISGTNANVKPPQLTLLFEGTVTGNAPPGMRVQLFSDYNAQGRFFEGELTVDASGTFVYTKPPQEWDGSTVTAIATDANGNSSAFSQPLFNPNAKRYTYLPAILRSQ